MEIINVTTAEQLQSLVDTSALTIEGLAKDNFVDFENWIKAHTAFRNERMYVASGRILNREWNLTGTNRYPDDLNVVSVKLSDLVEPMTMTFARFQIGARWMDDIHANNIAREQS